MPVKQCKGSNKYRIGTGECIYTSKDKANRAYKAYLAQQRTNQAPK